MSWELSLTIVSLCFLVLTIVLILFLLEIMKTAKQFQTTLQIVNNRLPDILSDFYELTKNLTVMSLALRGKIENLAAALEKVQKLTQFVELLKPAVETPLLKAVGNLNAFKKGFSIFLSALKSKGQPESKPEG